MRDKLRRIWPTLIVLPTIGAVLSAFIVWLNFGFADGFVLRWISSLLSAIPVIFFGFWIVGKLGPKVFYLLRAYPIPVRKLCLAALTACIMEALVAMSVTWSNYGFDVGFAGRWLAAFVGSLPLGCVISLLMVFVVKPRLDRLTAGPTPIATLQAQR